MSQSIYQVLGLQQLLEQSDLVELFKGFSEAEWTVHEPSNNTDDQEATSSCQTNVDNIIPYFCGSSREKASGALNSFLQVSCEGDTYKQGS